MKALFSLWMLFSRAWSVRKAMESMKRLPLDVPSNCEMSHGRRWTLRGSRQGCRVREQCGQQTFVWLIDQYFLQKKLFNTNLYFARKPLNHHCLRIKSQNKNYMTLSLTLPKKVFHNFLVRSWKTWKQLIFHSGKALRKTRIRIELRIGSSNLPWIYVSRDF